MLATAGEPPTAPGWAYEFKWDGVRAIVSVDRGRVSVVSRNDRDVSASYPELAAVGNLAPRRRMVLDAEIVALDSAGRPSFSLLQRRMLLCTTQEDTPGWSVQMLREPAVSPLAFGTSVVPYDRTTSCNAEFRVLAGRVAGHGNAAEGV